MPRGSGLDVTDDATHGAQQLAFFNGHYGHWCYLPMLVFLTFTTSPTSIRTRRCSPRQRTHPARNLALLKRILRRRQERSFAARILVRLDAGFAEPEPFEFLDEVDVKPGAQVVVSVCRIVLHLPESYLFLAVWRRVAVGLGVGPG